MRVVSLIPLYPPSCQALTFSRIPGINGAVLTRALRGVKADRDFVCAYGPPLGHSHLQGLGRVIAKDVDDLRDDRVFAWIRVGVRDLQREGLVFARPVGLPFVVEGVAAVVPVNRPVIDPLRPMLNGSARLLRHIVRRNDKILELQGDVAPVRYDLYR